MSFEVFAYSLDYLVDNKFKGSTTLTLEEGRDRELGYHGRETFKLESDLKLNNGRVLKKGTTVTTEMIALQGRVKKS